MRNRNSPVQQHQRQPPLSHATHASTSPRWLPSSTMIPRSPLLSPSPVNCVTSPSHASGTNSPQRCTDASENVGNNEFATATAQPTVEEKNRQHRRMPCKARNVPDDHKPETAYFDIHPHTEHGKVLICSHKECAASGRRFRYCAVCAIPVAKRNFLKRHSHGLMYRGSISRQGSSTSERDEEGEMSGDSSSGIMGGKRRRFAVAPDGSTFTESDDNGFSTFCRPYESPKTDAAQSAFHPFSNPQPSHHLRISTNLPPREHPSQQNILSPASDLRKRMETTFSLAPHNKMGQYNQEDSEKTDTNGYCHEEHSSNVKGQQNKATPPMPTDPKKGENGRQHSYLLRKQWQHDRNNNPSTSAVVHSKHVPSAHFAHVRHISNGSSGTEAPSSGPVQPAVSQSSSSEELPTVLMRLTQQEREWVNILHSRPHSDDQAAMHLWINSILKYSEPSPSNVVTPTASRKDGPSNVASPPPPPPSAHLPDSFLRSSTEHVPPPLPLIDHDVICTKPRSRSSSRNSNDHRRESIFTSGDVSPIGEIGAPPLGRPSSEPISIGNSGRSGGMDHVDFMYSPVSYDGTEHNHMGINW